MVRRWWERRRKLNRRDVDRYGWPHQRPATDPRLICLVIGLSIVLLVQTFITRPATTISAQAFTGPAALAVAVLVWLGSALLIAAAYWRSQYESFMLETASCVCFTGQCAIQFAAAVSVNPQWYGTTTMAWTFFFGLGNAIRSIILIRRWW